MAYDQQIQKQETEKSNIVNPKTGLTNGRLKLLQKLDPSSSQITPSLQTDEPLQKIWVCMTNGNCHGKYKICHKKYLMTKKQRHAGRHITTVT